MFKDTPLILYEYVVGSIWFPSFATCWGWFWKVRALLVEGCVASAARDGGAAGWLCWSWLSLGRYFCIVIVPKVSLSLGLEITCYVVGRKPIPHAYSMGVLIYGLLFLPVTNQLSNPEQDTKSLSPGFSHLWAGDGTCLTFNVFERVKWNSVGNIPPTQIQTALLF